LPRHVNARLYFMSQSNISAAGIHVAVIMDGNGRWAVARGRPRTAGHVAGASAVRRLVEAAREAGVGTLTLYAFSGDNWKRPAAEVNALMRLFRRYLAAETARCVSTGIRLRVIGRRDRLSEQLRRAVDAAECATQECRDMYLRIAVDYSARDTILAAARSIAAGETAAMGADDDGDRAAFAAAMGASCNDLGPVSDVDLLIRTGGEQRLSDFLLWECAYAELWFTQRAWPDFTAADLHAALRDFQGRQRRFGAVAEGGTPPAREASIADATRLAAG